MELVVVGLHNSSSYEVKLTLLLVVNAGGGGRGNASLSQYICCKNTTSRHTHTRDVTCDLNQGSKVRICVFDWPFLLLCMDWTFSGSNVAIANKGLEMGPRQIKIESY